MSNKESRSSLTWLGFTGLGLVALLAFTQIDALNPFRSRPFTEVGPTVVESVQQLSKLTSVEYVEYTTVEKGNDRGWLNWARGDRVFMFAVARIGAGVDLDRLEDDDVTVDAEKKSVRIYLPAAEITYITLDNEATTVYDRDTGLFNRGDPQLESDARLVAEQVLRDSALEKGILDTASANAADTITAFLKGLGYTEISVIPRPVATS